MAELMTDLVPHIHPFRIYYDDTDAGGIVYYANYLRFAEHGRTEMLRTLGFERLDMMENGQLAFAVRGCDVEYLSPAKLDDALEVHTRVTKVGGASLHLDQRVVKDDVVITEINIRLVCMHITGDLIGRPSRIPADIRDALIQVTESKTDN
jgi:acyl-CoA thioester hydrolase